MAVLYAVHLLLPIVVMIAAFIMFVLWLTGLIKASIELWGPLGSINDNCVRYVYNDDFWGGGNLYTLARIQQEVVCNLWQTTFALEMIATLVFSLPIDFVKPSIQRTNLIRVVDSCSYG